MAYRTTRPKPTGLPGIRQDGPSRFLVRVRWNDPRTGQRRKRECVATSLEEAVAMKSRLKGEEPSPTPTRQRFEDYAEQWMKMHGTELAPSTTHRYLEALAHACSHLGPIYIDAIQPVDVREWVRRHLKGRAATTVNSRLRVLRRVFDDAVADGLLAGNPARAVRALKEKRTQGRRARSLTREEFHTFVNTLQAMAGGMLAEDVARLLLAAAWTGMRKGELLALRWEDLADGEITVTRAVWMRQEKATKTDDPRKVAVVEPLARALADQRAWLLETQHPGLSSGLMFPANPRQAAAGAVRRGAETVSWYRSPTIFDKALRKVVKEAKVTDISAHSLRRTWENLLREAGVEQLVRRSMAGWRSEKAQAIYATVNRGEREAAGAAMVTLVLGVGGG